MRISLFLALGDWDFDLNACAYNFHQQLTTMKCQSEIQRTIVIHSSRITRLDHHINDIHEMSSYLNLSHLWSYHQANQSPPFSRLGQRRLPRTNTHRPIPGISWKKWVCTRVSKVGLSEDIYLLCLVKNSVSEVLLAEIWTFYGSFWQNGRCSLIYPRRCKLWRNYS